MKPSLPHLSVETARPSLLRAPTDSDTIDQLKESARLLGNHPAAAFHTRLSQVLRAKADAVASPNIGPTPAVGDGIPAFNARDAQIEQLHAQRTALQYISRGAPIPPSVLEAACREPPPCSATNADPADPSQRSPKLPARSPQPAPSEARPWLITHLGRPDAFPPNLPHDLKLKATVHRKSAKFGELQRTLRLMMAGQDAAARQHVTGRDILWEPALLRARDDATGVLKGRVSVLGRPYLLAPEFSGHSFADIQRYARAVFAQEEHQMQRRLQREHERRLHEHIVAASRLQKAEEVSRHAFYTGQLQRAIAWKAARSAVADAVKERERSKAIADGVWAPEKRGKEAMRWHRQQAGKKARDEAQRVAALKQQNYSAYLQLAASAKSGRLRDLISMTDSIMGSLTDKVNAHQRRVAESSHTQYEEAQPDDSVPAHQRYYNAVHRCQSAGVEAQPAMLRGGTLREYQMQGVSFMKSLANSHMNGILADEMGLGKTIQTIAFLATLMEQNNNWGPFLVLAPKAVISNWANEFDRWLPDQCAVVVYDGPAEVRKYLQKDTVRNTQFNVLLTHYQLAINDRSVLSKIQWEVLIVDEGHRLKNEHSRLFHTLNTFSIKSRFLLTGTPIQNSLSELWALLHFILPSVFSSGDTFDKWFCGAFSGDSQDVLLTQEELLLVINRLHAVLRPLMIRRTKAEVAAELPAKTERVVRCDLSAWQKDLYRRISTARRITDASGRSMSLNNLMMHLRKACLHPALFYDGYIAPTADELVSASGKLVLLHDILPKLKAGGHRILLFSQFTQVLDVLQRFLENEGHPFLRLDGSTRTAERTATLAEFNRPDSPYFVFLLSTRAGGLGLNLQTADTVIIFDQDWNPQMDLQAEDRAHRIGQQRRVLVLILVCSGTVEEVMLTTSQRKRSIDAKVIQAGMFNANSTASEREKMLQDILRKGSHVTMGDSKADNVHEREQINELIARSEEEIALFQAMDAELDALSEQAAASAQLAAEAAPAAPEASGGAPDVVPAAAGSAGKTRSGKRSSKRQKGSSSSASGEASTVGTSKGAAAASAAALDSAALDAIRATPAWRRVGLMSSSQIPAWVAEAQEQARSATAAAAAEAGREQGTGRRTKRAKVMPGFADVSHPDFNELLGLEGADAGTMPQAPKRKYVKRTRAASAEGEAAPKRARGRPPKIAAAGRGGRRRAAHDAVSEQTPAAAAACEEPAAAADSTAAPADQSADVSAAPA